MLLGSLPFILFALIIPDKTVQWTPYLSLIGYMQNWKLHSVIGSGLRLDEKK